MTMLPELAYEALKGYVGTSLHVENDEYTSLLQVGELKGRTVSYTLAGLSMTIKADVEDVLTSVAVSYACALARGMN